MIYKTVFEANLIQEYLNLVFNRYILTQPGILCTYYSFDPDNSVYDAEHLATYDTPGNKVNDLSGITYKAIHNLMLPFGTRTQRQEYDSQQKGYNSYDTLHQIFLPSVYKIRPFKYDLIYYEPVPNDGMLFTITNIEDATLTVKTSMSGWYLSLRPSNLRLDELQISDILAFDTFTNSIIDFKLYNKRLYYAILLDKINKLLLKYFNPRLSCFVYESHILDKKFTTITTVIRESLQKYFNQINWLYTTYKDKDFWDRWYEAFMNQSCDKLCMIDIDRNLYSLDVESIDISQLESLNICELLVTLTLLYTKKGGLNLEN